MAMAENLNKPLYKSLLVIIKIIPIILALGYMINTLFGYLGIDNAILSYFVGISLFPWIFLYISSFVFKFCVYHRMLLYYILMSDVVNITDYYMTIPLNDFYMIQL